MRLGAEGTTRRQHAGNGGAQWGLASAWSDFYARQASEQLSKQGAPSRDEVDAILERLTDQLMHVSRCAEFSPRPGHACSLKQEVYSPLFSRSAIVHLCEMPDGTVLCATHQGDVGRYNSRRSPIDWVATGLGHVSAMEPLPDGRVLVGTACGRGFALVPREERYDASFFTWSGGEIGPIYSIQGFPDGRILVLARDGILEWRNADYPSGVKRIEAFPQSTAVAFRSQRELYTLQWDGSVFLGSLCGSGKGQVLGRVALHPHACKMGIDPAGRILTVGPYGVFRVWGRAGSKPEALRDVEFEGNFAEVPSHIQPLKGGGFLAVSNGRGIVLEQDKDGTWGQRFMSSVLWSKVAPHLAASPGAPSLQLRSGEFLTVASTVSRQHHSVLCVFDTGAGEI